MSRARAEAPLVQRLLVPHSWFAHFYILACVFNGECSRAVTVVDKLALRRGSRLLNFRRYLAAPPCVPDVARRRWCAPLRSRTTLLTNTYRALHATSQPIAAARSLHSCCFSCTCFAGLLNGAYSRVSWRVSCMWL